jgi:uncharacterized Zn finger protein
MPRRGGYYGHYDDYFPPRSRPLEAKGGIKARSQRGAFGQSWWARRWIAVLEGFDMGARLARGRSYARNGQVVAIEVARGIVTARVQGSRPKPYNVRIQVGLLAPAEWERAARAITGWAVFAAKLLNGEMPQDIEAAFAESGVSLFPTSLNEIETSCSCPDWSNPCKHIAAVYFLIGEEFDRDPFLLFTLRGLERGDLFALLGSALPRAESGEESGEAQQSEPLPGDAAAFWQGQPLPEGFAGEVQAPLVAAALLRRLGPFPFWRVTRDLREIVEPVYTAATARGTAALAGELPPPAAGASSEGSRRGTKQGPESPMKRPARKRHS